MFPLERKFASPKELSVAIGNFLESIFTHKPDRHVSDLEATTVKIVDKMFKNKSNAGLVKSHGKFYSFYEEKIRRMEMLPPRTPKSLAMVG